MAYGFYVFERYDLIELARDVDEVLADVPRERIVSITHSSAADRDDIPVTWQGFTSKGPTRIGSNCWFGVNCVVNTGVTIGDRCVIGANSVVTKDIPSGVIAAGTPAKVIREIEFRQGDRR